MGKQITLEEWDKANKITRFAYLQNGDFLSNEDADKLEERIKDDMHCYGEVARRMPFWEQR